MWRQMLKAAVPGNVSALQSADDGGLPTIRTTAMVDRNKNQNFSRNPSYVFSPLFGRLTRLVITTASSAGSTGLATCIWKPAFRARIRSSTRP